MCGWGMRYGLGTGESGKDSVKVFQTLDKKQKTETVPWWDDSRE